MLNEFKQNIEVQKEVLNALPRNNNKNQKNYIGKVVEILEKYKETNEIVISEIKKRKKRYESLEENSKIEKISKKINSLKPLLNLTNPFATSYEKSNLDQILYELGHFYENDLEKVNEDIKKGINVFEKVGITLTNDDFMYSYYSNKYMEKFLNPEICAEELKQNFEEIYWKCPEIITHITLNFKYLYYQNKKKFDAYYEDKKESLINVQNDYKNLVEEKEELIRNDAYLLQKSFLEGKLNINDYTQDKIKKAYKSVVNEENEEKIKEEVIKLYNNVIEYKNYLDFEYIITDLKNLYKEKDKYKNIYINKKKEIDKIESKLFKNVKIIFKKEKKFEVLNSIINTEISNLKERYEELERNSFLEQIMNLEENTTIYDLFVLALSNYTYLVKKEETNVSKLNAFITNPRINILKNILINEEKNIGLLIMDRYNLFGFNLTKEQLEKDNLDNLIKELETILGSIEMEKLSITENKIKFIKESSQILA